MLCDLLVKSDVECRHDEAGTKEWMECWVRQLELVDKARWVSRVKWPGEVELSMPELVEVMVEVMMEVQVETVDWAMCPAEWKDSGVWIDS